MLPPLTPAAAKTLATLCRQHHVRSLALFGSAARGHDFSPEHSDIDLLLEYQPDHPTPSLAEYLALRDALTHLFARKIDLVMANAIDNPFLRASIEREKAALYAA